MWMWLLSLMLFSFSVDYQSKTFSSFLLLLHCSNAQLSWQVLSWRALLKDIFAGCKIMQWPGSLSASIFRSLASDTSVYLHRSRCQTTFHHSSLQLAPCAPRCMLATCSLRQVDVLSTIMACHAKNVNYYSAQFDFWISVSFPVGELIFSLFLFPLTRQC